LPGPPEHAKAHAGINDPYTTMFALFDALVNQRSGAAM
jgi:hypothetical protein